MCAIDGNICGMMRIWYNICLNSFYHNYLFNYHRVFVNIDLTSNLCLIQELCLFKKCGRNLEDLGLARPSSLAKKKV